MGPLCISHTDGRYILDQHGAACTRPALNVWPPVGSGAKRLSSELADGLLTAVDASSSQPDPALLPPAGCDRRLETDLTGEAGVSQRAVALLYLMCLLALFGGSSFLRHCQADLRDAGGERGRDGAISVMSGRLQFIRSESGVSRNHRSVVSCTIFSSDNSKHLLLVKLIPYAQSHLT